MKSGLTLLLLTAAAASPAGDFPAPYPGCRWIASLRGGNEAPGPCNATSAAFCPPGDNFVATHSLACSPPKGVAVRPELLVFLPGGAPANYSLLLASAAGWGFRAISPTFNNIDAPNAICDGGPGHFGYTGGGDKARSNQTMAYPDCMFDVEQERLFGVERFYSSVLAWRQANWDSGCRKTSSCPGCSPNSSVCHPYNVVPQNESIVARMAAALTALSQVDSAGGWASFLLPEPDLHGNRVAWNRTVVSGHSRGSAYPLHIGYYWKPKRLVFFAGLEDYQGTRGLGTIRKPPSIWAGKAGLSTPAPWVLGYAARAKRLHLVPPEDMYGLGPMGGSCCHNWQATWSALGIPGQTFADDTQGKVLPPSALRGAHKIFLRGRFQGHGTPIINCNAIGPTDPFNTGCCAFCGEGAGSCAHGNCSDRGKGVKCECVATDDTGAAGLAEIWKYLFTSTSPVGSALPAEQQMHCCGGEGAQQPWCCEDAQHLTGIATCSHKGAPGGTRSADRALPLINVEVINCTRAAVNMSLFLSPLTTRVDPATGRTSLRTNLGNLSQVNSDFVLLRDSAGVQTSRAFAIAADERPAFTTLMAVVDVSTGGGGSLVGRHRVIPSNCSTPSNWNPLPARTMIAIGPTSLLVTHRTLMGPLGGGVDSGRAGVLNEWAEVIATNQTTQDWSSTVVYNRSQPLAAGQPVPSKYFGDEWAFDATSGLLYTQSCVGAELGTGLACPAAAGPVHVWDVHRHKHVGDFDARNMTLRALHFDKQTSTLGALVYKGAGADAADEYTLVTMDVVSGQFGPVGGIVALPSEYSLIGRSSAFDAVTRSLSLLLIEPTASSGPKRDWSGGDPKQVLIASLPIRNTGAAAATGVLAPHVYKVNVLDVMSECTPGNDLRYRVPTLTYLNNEAASEQDALERP